MNKIKIYYFENYTDQEPKFMNFTKNINDCLEYLLSHLGKDFNFIIYQLDMIYRTRIGEILGDSDCKKFIKDKKLTFSNGVTMYRILKNDPLNLDADVVFFYITHPDEIDKITKKAKKDYMYFLAPYKFEELEILKNNDRYEMISIQ